MIKKILNNDSNRHVLTLLTGTAVAQVIPILISPLLTRLYTPSDFGVLALFIAITTIFGVVATGQYELAIVLPDNEEDAINLTALSVAISCCLSFGLFLIIAVFHHDIVLLLGNNAISPWLYFSPLVVLFIGVFNAFNYLNTRVKTYKNIAQVNVCKSLALAFIQLGLGMMKVGVAGLVSGQIISHLVANGKLAVNFIKEKRYLKMINRKAMKRLARQHINFPKFNVGAMLMNTLSFQLTAILISNFFTLAILGQYALVQRILVIPAYILGSSVGQVFLQQASEEKNEHGQAVQAFRSSFKKLMMTSLPIFIIIYFTIEPMVTLVFGKEWAEAGEFAKILVPLFLIRFIVSPLSELNAIFDKQKVSLYWQIGLLALTIMTFLIAQIFSLTIVDFLKLYVAVIAIHYGFLLFLLNKYSKGSQQQVIKIHAASRGVRERDIN